MLKIIKNLKEAVVKDSTTAIENIVFINTKGKYTIEELEILAKNPPLLDDYAKYIKDGETDPANQAGNLYTLYMAASRDMQNVREVLGYYEVPTLKEALIKLEEASVPDAPITVQNPNVKDLETQVVKLTIERDYLKTVVGTQIGTTTTQTLPTEQVADIILVKEIQLISEGSYKEDELIERYKPTSFLYTPTLETIRDYLNLSDKLKKPQDIAKAVLEFFKKDIENTKK